MYVKKIQIASAAAAALALPFLAAGSAAALTASCVGTPGPASITWSASAAGGIEPYAFLWGNGSASSSQIVSATPGTYSMTLQATDASSTVATTTCSATVTVTATSTGSGSSLAQQIQALLAQINALKAQIVQLLAAQGSSTPGTGTSTPPVATSTVPCFAAMRDLHDGDEGDDVKELQQFLAHNYPNLLPPGLVTGFFGKRTMEAIKHFQEENGILASGFFGPLSRQQLKAQCGVQDSDHDGTPNAQDSDDDNDGVPDSADIRPFNPKIDTSTVSAGAPGNGEWARQRNENHKDEERGRTDKYDD